MSASRSSDSTRMDVSSLCTTSPCAAWRVSSCSAGWRMTAVSATISHCVATGSGMPRLFSRPCSLYHGTPLPYRSRAIMLAAVSSYFFSPTPSGAAAVNTSDLNAQALFQALQSVPRNSAPIPQQGDHARRRLIVLLLAHAFRRRRRKYIPAQIAPQLLQLIYGRGDGRLPFDPHQHARVTLRIYFAAASSIRTRSARLQ